MIKKTDQKIKKAIAKGELISYEKVLKSFSEKERREILDKARYLQTAMVLRSLRKQLKLSQEKLAEKMKVKREFICRIESGEQNITLETLYRIAEATKKKFYFSFQ